MQKRIVPILCLLMALCLLSGCAQKRQSSQIGVADNEILTYRPLNADKTTLLLSRTGNAYITDLAAAFEAKNPDVQVVCLDISGGTSGVAPVVDWVINGMAPDVMIVMTGTFSNEQQKAYFEDLSASPVIASYEAEELNAVSVDSRIYTLPGPRQISAMIYNRTMFEQYGWEVPRTFDEFVTLCVRIREDTNGAIQPWNPNAKYYNEFMTVTQGFVYQELFGGLENRAWYESFCRGTASYSEHMGPYYDMIQKLIDNGILREEHFTYSATTRGVEFGQGKIAMCNFNIANHSSDAYDFDYMPFPATSGEDGYICTDNLYLLAVPKKEHTPEERDALDRFVAFFSSPEGQKAFIGDSLMVSSVKGSVNDVEERISALAPAIADGRMFTLLDFKSQLGRRSFSPAAHAKAMLMGEKTAAECMAETDAKPFLPSEEPEPERQEALAVAAEDFTTLETSFFIADMYRDKTGADIALINNTAFRGNVMRIFKGDLTAAHVTTLLPRSLDNKSKLLKVEMTGRQLLDALNEPIGYNDRVSDSTYAYSGLKCKVAPWKPQGERMLTVALANGREIEPDSLYTVAIWEGTVYNQYITKVVETYEGTFEELLTDRLRVDKTITPVKDGRITLVWEE